MLDAAQLTEIKTPPIRHNVWVSEILILARVRLRETDLPVVADYYFEVDKRHSQSEGSYGLSVWRDTKDPESFLVAYEYADLAAADRGLVAISEVRYLAETELIDFKPAHVLRVRVHGRDGKRLSQTPQSASLSMSVRVADPGYGPELLEELGRVFDELQLITGHLGSVYGTNDGLDEEVIGIATWIGPDALKKSLPRKAGASTLELYTRFF